MAKKKEKKKYVTPELTTYGSVETITKGNSFGVHVDAVFPIGIPKDQITFS
jgi:hypothetical protein